MAISASRRNDAAFLFRHRLTEFRVLPAKYLYNGFVNRMRHASDLRRLTCDVLLERTELRPVGKQIRPGVWAGRGVRVERGARVVAPAYLGEGARIRAAAVVTRGSSVGHHAEIDCGTIVDASSVLRNCDASAIVLSPAVGRWRCTQLPCPARVAHRH